MVVGGGGGFLLLLLLFWSTLGRSCFRHSLHLQWPPTSLLSISEGSHWSVASYSSSWAAPLVWRILISDIETLRVEVGGQPWCQALDSSPSSVIWQST